jgi:hypothetical protein
MNITIDARAESVVLKKRSFHRNTPIEDEHSALLWACKAFEILMKEEELNDRHSIVDDLIEKAQLLYMKINDFIKEVKPVRLAYSFFFEEKRPLIARVHRIRGPNESYVIAKKVAKWWKMITPAEKAKYRLMEEEDRQCYNNIQHYHFTQQHQVLELIDWFNNNRSHILLWPTDVLLKWSEMIFKKIEN